MFCCISNLFRLGQNSYNLLLGKIFDNRMKLFFLSLSDLDPFFLKLCRIAPKSYIECMFNWASFICMHLYDLLLYVFSLICHFIVRKCLTCNVQEEFPCFITQNISILLIFKLQCSFYFLADIFRLYDILVRKKWCFVRIFSLCQT